MRFSLYRIRPPLSFYIFLIILLSAKGIFSQNYVVQTYTQEDGLPSSTVHSIIQGSLGRIWIGTRNGVTVYDGLDWQYFNVKDGLRDSEVFCLREDSLGRIWASTLKNSIHISFYDGSRWNNIEYPSFKLNKDIIIRSFDILNTGSKTQILVTSDNGLFYFYESKWKNITTRDGLPSNYCTNIISHQNKFYVATNRGVVTFYNGKLDLSLNKIIPESYKEILAIAFDRNEKNNRLWILSTNCLGYIEDNIFHVVDNNLNIKDNLRGECVQFIPDYYGLAIFGNMYGLTLCDKSSGRLFTLSEQSGIRILNPYTIYFDRESNLWLGGREE